MKIRPGKFDLFLLLATLIPCWIIAARFEVDIKTVYRVAVLSHGDLSQIYATVPGIGRFFYGPFYLILVKPLGYLSFTAVKWIWIGIQTLSYGVFFYFLYVLFPIFNENRFLPFLLLWIFALNPVHNNFQSNNLQLFLMAVLIAAEAYSTSELKWKQVTAGALVAFASAIKVFPLFIVLLYFILKKTRVKVGIIMGGLISLFAPLLFFGFTGTETLFRGFFANLTSYQSDNSFLQVPDILCFPSMAARIGAWFSWSEGTVALITKGITLLVVAGFFVAVIQLRKKGPELYLWCLALLLMTLLNPSTRVHYFIFYVPAFCALLQLAKDEPQIRLPLKIPIVLSLLMISFTMEGVVGKQMAHFFEWKNVPTLGVVLLGATLFHCIRHRPAYFRASVY